MNLPYIPRLVCVALDTFFLTYFAVASVVACCAALAIRVAGRRSPRRAARFLFSLRMLPFVLASFATIGLCVPSFLWFESEPFDEPVGLVCVAMALLAIAVCAFAIVRATRALIRSARFARHEGKCARVVALTGILRPRVVISPDIANALSGEELAVVMSHEHAHRAACDNLKRLCVLLAPGSKALERAWINFAEYAADQEAVGGDTQRSLALASALVRVARLGGTAQVSSTATSFLADISQLSVRVNRLLSAPRATEFTPKSWHKLVIALGLAPALFCPATLRFVHSLLERLLSLVVLSTLR